jgi:hypothetical protein
MRTQCKTAAYVSPLKTPTTMIMRPGVASSASDRSEHPPQTAGLHPVPNLKVMVEHPLQVLENRGDDDEPRRRGGRTLTGICILHRKGLRGFGRRREWVGVSPRQVHDMGPDPSQSPAARFHRPGKARHCELAGPYGTTKSSVRGSTFERTKLISSMPSINPILCELRIHSRSSIGTTWAQWRVNTDSDWLWPHRVIKSNSESNAHDLSPIRG